MTHSRRKLQKNWLYIFLILVIGIISVTGYMTFIGVKKIEDITTEFSEFYYDENKSRIKREVENRLYYIDNEMDNLTRYHMNVIKHEANHLGSILENMDIREIEDLDERSKTAATEFGKLVKFDLNLHYFIINPDGVLLKSRMGKEFEGLNLTDVVEGNDVHVIGEILGVVDKEEGSFVEYFMSKEKGAEALRTVSYCYYLESYDIIIVTGVYYDAIQDEMKQAVYDSIQNYYEDREEYMFIITYDGIAEVTNSFESVGRDLSDARDKDGKSIHDKFMAIVTGEGRGFNTYSYFEKDGIDISEKVSYAIKMDEWNAYIGMGFYTDDLKEVSEGYSKQYKSDYISEVHYIIFLLILGAVLIFIFIRRGIRLLRQYLKREEGMFTQLMQMIIEGVVIVDSNNKIKYYNRNASKYFSEDKEMSLTEEMSRFKKIENNIYKIGMNERDYYVEIKEDLIDYHKEVCRIYFIENITTQYLKTNEFLQMSYIDELTQLPNRRVLANDYEDLFQAKKEQSYILGMIDIDCFKVINDTHGHAFGDEVLKLLAEVFSKRLRNTDKIYRFGGEEFIIILEGTTLEIAQKLVMEINKDYLKEVQEKFDVSSTFSGGLTLVDKHIAEKSLNDIVKEADALMYKAKDNGRNRVEI